MKLSDSPKDWRRFSLSHRGSPRPSDGRGVGGEGKPRAEGHVPQKVWRLSPEATPENSPGFQRWVSPGCQLSPEGAAQALPRPPLWDLEWGNPEPSVETLGC